MKLTALSAGHKKDHLVRQSATDTFYEKLGFRRMKTAMAIFSDQERAIRRGLVEGACGRVFGSSVSLRKNNPELKALFDTAIAVAKADGAAQNLPLKWF